MILRREHLGEHPSVFRAMTGLTVEAFDRLLPGWLDASLPRVAAAWTGPPPAGPVQAVPPSTWAWPTSSC